jgi:hypothetical protein
MDEDVAERDAIGWELTVCIRETDYCDVSPGKWVWTHILSDEV